MMCDLVIGIDPDYSKIPDYYKRKGDVDLIGWGSDILSVCKSSVVGVKFQMAYFEQFGIHGYKSVQELIALAKAFGLNVIMDAKRGDIGSTSSAYAKAYLAPENHGRKNEFESDFLTVNPLMGEDCLKPFIDTALDHKKGVFILLETSNPGASMILKETLPNGTTISNKIADFIQGVHNELGLNEDEFGPLGCVIGATNQDVSHWRERLPNSCFLMPGIGAQGGSWSVAKSCLNSKGKGVMVPISRGITSVNPKLDSHAEICEALKQNLQQVLNDSAG